MKNKKSVSVIAMIAVMMLTSCSNGTGADQHVQSTTSGVQDVIESRMASEDGNDEVPADVSENTDETSQPDLTDVDFDLVNMNADMVYANVYALMTDPETYVGFTVRMHGSAISYYDEATDTTYYACFISDAAQCCSQGIEYRLTEGEYPEDDTEFTVAGVFETYTEGGKLYVRLDNAVIE